MLKIQQDIRNFLEERDWINENAAGYAKSISIEAAELLEHFQWNEPTASELKKDPEKLEKIRKELADVLIYCLDFSVIIGVDAEEVVRAKIEHNRKKFPVELVKGKADAAKKIQQEWRRKGIN